MRHRPALLNFFRLAATSIVAATVALPQLAASGASLPRIQTVFIIVLENHEWADFKNNPDAPFLNQTLLPMASICENYSNPPGLHPSLPNYLWLEAGTNFGIFDNNPPSLNHLSTTNHLTSLLERAGISWKTYQEDIDGSVVPLDSTNNYAAKHNPFVYFDDITGTNDPNNRYGLAHIRPYSEFSSDLANQTVARYNFITPNLCNGGHDLCSPLFNAVQQTDHWLADEVPKILASSAYRNSGALFITWDEGEGYGDGAIGMIVLSPLARGGGYSNHIPYTHSSTVRTLQTIFGVTPLLNDAANAADLSDLFTRLKITRAQMLPEATVQLTLEIVPGTTNIGQCSEDLLRWTSFSTNVGTANPMTVPVPPTDSSRRFYRFLEVE